MIQYIDKAILLAEIEKRQSIVLDPLNNNIHTKRLEEVYKSILSFINTLEVKEIDLNLEITLWANAIPEIQLNDVERLAKYFFELGLQAKSKII